MKMAGPVRPAYFLYHSLWQGLDWLFPPTCGGCGRIGIRWCPDCQAQLQPIRGPVCDLCGDPLLPVDLQPAQPSAASCPPARLCRDCATTPPLYQALRSFGVFTGPLREAMHRLKYKGDMGLGEALSKHLIELYNDLKWDINLVVPVPLSAERNRERGYNQSSLLCRPLAYALDKPYLPAALSRSRNTRTQVGLSAKERRKNVEGAFIANPDQVKRKVVLVIDDVTTTGSTISACAQALHQAGASAVFGLTLARAVLQADADDQPNLSLN